MARGLWFGLAALALTYYAILAPVEFSRIQASLTADQVAQLQTYGLTPTSLALYFTALQVCFVLVSFAIGGLIFWRKSDDRMALLAAVTLVTFGTIGFSDTLRALPPSLAGWRLLLTTAYFVGDTCSFLLFYLFPDGRFIPRWTRWLAVLLIGVELVARFFPELVRTAGSWASIVYNFATLVFLVSIVAAQVYRFRHVSGPVQRQQTKWVVFGVTAAVLGSPGVTLLILLAGYSSTTQMGVPLIVATNTMIYIALLFIPFSIGVAVLRYRLWDINIILQRTLVYAVLTACVIVIYGLVVGALGAVFQVWGSPLVSLVGTVLAAVLFQPLRERVQRGVSRLVYGERDEPYAVLARLGQRLEATLAPDAVLPTIVETVAQALRSPAVAMDMSTEVGFRTVAAYPALKPLASPSPRRQWDGEAESGDEGGVLTLPLVYQHERVGQLHVAPRAPGERYSPADRRLLEALARQAGVAVHAVRLTEDLRRLSQDLQKGREQLVLAREEERRRLRRDLHDGLGPTLAALALAASQVVDLIDTDPTTATTLARELQREIRATVQEVRRLVYDLRPPTLDELGLEAAIRELAASLQRRLPITVDTPTALPPLPAAVEVAAFRIVQEALTNVVRHAEARTCAVRLSLWPDTQTPTALHVDIVDDGVGIAHEHHTGVGLLSMRERAEELGGTCEVTPPPTGGTHIHATLPLTGFSS